MHLWIRCAAWLYRRFLGLCPARCFGKPGEVGDRAEVCEVFEQVLQEELRTGGWTGFLLCCFGALTDAAVLAVVECARALASNPSMGGDQRRALARSVPTSTPLRQEAAIPMLWNQIRHGFRSISRTPAQSTVAIVVIALAVGLTAMTLSTIDGVMLSSLPSDPEGRLMAIDLTDAAEASKSVQFEALDLMDFRQRQSSFESLDGYMRRRVSLATDDRGAHSVRAGVVTATALSSLGVHPQLGRTFVAGEDFKRDIHSVVIGHRLWQRSFEGSPEIVGRQVQVDGRSLQVVGVMPEGFRFPIDEEIWLPMDFDLPVEDRGSGRSFSVFGKLKVGVDASGATAEARVIAARIAQDNPDFHPPLSAVVYPFPSRHLPDRLGSLLKVMLLAVAGLLLISCANVANLLLARGLHRSHETEVHKALGATRRAIASRFLVEALQLSMLGSSLGLAVAYVGCRALEGPLIGRLSLPYWVSIELRPAIAAATIALTSAVAVAAGLLPALRSTRSDNSLIASRTEGGRRLGRASAWLVTAQIATSCALLIASGLLTKSLVQLRHLDLGFDSARVASAEIRLAKADYPNGQARSAFFLELLERVASLPGVSGATLARNAPGTGPTFSWDFEVENKASLASGRPASADGVPVGHDYSAVMGIELLQGREFSAEETRSGTDPVVIVNETLTTRHLGDQPVGRRIRLGIGDPDAPWLTVVGVVADTYIGSYSGGIGLDPSPKEQMYISWGVAPYSAATLLLRSEAVEPTAVMPAVRAILRDIAPLVPLYRVQSLRDAIVESTWAFGVFGSLFGLFGLVALTISAIGLYGVTSFAVGQRRQEFAVRIALGAAPRSIFRLVLGAAAGQLGLGIALGLGGGFLLARSIRAALFDVGTADPWTYGTIVIILAATALLAAIVPGRKATRVEPMDVLGS